MTFVPLFRIVALLAAVLVIAGGTAEATIYKYQRSDGTWVFTDDPSKLPGNAKAMEGVGGGLSAPAVDLAARLVERLRPRNGIEEAALATVVVQSGVGRGSGFFISEDGYLLTNRHVIRTTERRKKQRAARDEQVEMKIAEHRRRFKAEQAGLDAAKAELESYRPRLYPRSYTAKKSEYERRQQDLDRRKAQFAADVDKIRDRLKEEGYRQRLADIERSFTIILADKTELRAHLVETSDSLDLALLKLEGHRTPWVAPAAPHEVAVGGSVYAIGNPAELNHSAAAGILSGYEMGYIKTDARIYPGNSGGPLVTGDGKVIGINTFKKLTYRYEGLGFAIPVHAALKEFARHLGR